MAISLLSKLPVTARWLLLILVSIGLAGLLEWGHLPAALLLGPLLAAIWQQSAGGTVKVPAFLSAGALSVVGCLVAGSITPDIVAGFLLHWPTFIGVVLVTLAASVGIGWAMHRLHIIRGSTAVWGMLPGAASAMMLMSEAHGADYRLVAFMQYLRVACVAAAASIVAAFFARAPGAHFATGLAPSVDWPNFAATVLVASIGGLLGKYSRMPAGLLMGPLLLGAVVSVTGWVRIELPPMLLIASYSMIGWNTGLRFTREVLAAARRALLPCIGATVLLMVFCGGLAWLLVRTLHVDPLTAYLATSPGGIDSVAIIAASTKVDTQFVMALQTVRMLVLVLVGPILARWVASRIDRQVSRSTVPPPASID